jgi:hypothetical protein
MNPEELHGARPRGFQKGHKGFIPKHRYAEIAKKISATKTGKKLSEYHRQRMSETRKGRGLGNTYGFKKGQIPWNKGWLKPNAKTRKVGYAALKNQKRRARKKITVGSHTLEQWDALRKQHKYTCVSCKKTEPFLNQRYQYLTEDHIIPICKGGSDNIGNIQPLCLRCNDSKGTKIIMYG